MHDFLNEIKRVPFVQVIIPFILGIGLGFSCNVFVDINLMLIIASVLFVTLFFLLLYKSFTNRWLWGMFANLLLFVLGYVVAINNIDKVNENNRVLNAQSIIASIDEPLVLKGQFYKGIINIKYLKAKAAEKVDIPVMAYFRADSVKEAPKLGNWVIISCKPMEIPAVANPDAFDYKKYLFNKCITAQVFCKNNEWQVVYYKEVINIQVLLFKFREKLLNKFKINIQQKNEYGVLSALVFGYTGDLTEEVKSAYSSTGITHILSVSGLHVGIVFMMFGFLFSFLEKMPGGKVLKIILLLSVLWFYALLTGMSPPVIRSAATFSFLSLATLSKGRVNSINLLAASAFIILLLNPFQLTDIGFQLSYLAVLGILLFYEPAYKFLQPKTWIADKVWALLCVSVVAQLATFPLCLYYFHQFPNLFFITNLVVVPLTNGILYMGIIMLFFSAWDIVFRFSANILDAILGFMNGFIFMLEKIPFTTSKGIYLSAFDMVFYYLLISAFILFLLYKNTKWLFAALVVVLMLFISISVREINQINQKQLVVYQIKGKTAIDIVNGKNHKLLTGENVKPKDVQFAAGTFWIKHGLVNEGSDNAGLDTFTLFNNKVLSLNKKNIVWLNNESVFKYSSVMRIKADFLIISGSVNFSIHSILKYFKPGQIVFDSSVKRHTLDKWKKECAMLNISCFSVAENGAFVTSL